MSLKYFTGDTAPEPKPIEWLIPNYLAKGAGTILFGQPGVSKTAHSAVLTACLCLGRPFAEMPVAKAYRVLYISLDAGWDWTADLFQAAFRGLGFNGLPSSFAFWSPLDGNAEGDEMDNSLEFIAPALLEACKAHRADVVVIDSLGQFIAGDSNKSQDVSLALRSGLNPLRAAGAAVLVIDHATKAAQNMGATVPTPTGSQQKRAWARVTVALEEVEYNGDRATRWSVDKTNAKPFEPFITRLEFDTRAERLHSLTIERLGEAGSREVVPKLTAKQRGRRVVIEQLKRRASNWATLVDLEGISSESALKRVLDDLKKEGIIEHDTTTKLYSLPSSNPLKDGSLEVTGDKTASDSISVSSKPLFAGGRLEVAEPSTSKTDFQGTSTTGSKAEKDVQDEAKSLPLLASEPKTSSNQVRWYDLD